MAGEPATTGPSDAPNAGYETARARARKLLSKMKAARKAAAAAANNKLDEPEASNNLEASDPTEAGPASASATLNSTGPPGSATPQASMAPPPYRRSIPKDRFSSLFGTLKTQAYLDPSSRGIPRDHV